MPDVADLQVKIGADLSGLQRGLEQAQRSIRQFAAGTGTSGAGLTQMQRSSDKAAKGLTDMQRASDRTAQSFKTNLVTAIQTIEGPLSRTGAIVTRLSGPAGFAALAAIGVATFARIGVAAFRAANDIDGAFAAIRRGTGATGPGLAQLGNDFRAVFAEVPEDAKAVGQAIADLNTRLGLTGKPLQDITKQMLDLGRITGEDEGVIRATTRVFGDWGVAVGQQGDALNFLFRATQQTGVGISQLSDQLVNFGAPLRAMGFSLEESAALLAKFELEGVAAERTMSGLRQGLSNFARAGEEAPAALQRLITEMQNMESRTQATALAMEVFGAEAGPDMAAAIQEGRFAVEELLQTLRGGTDTIAAAADESATFGEQMAELRHQVALTLEPLGRGMVEAFKDNEDAIKGAVEGFGGLITGIGDLKGEIESSIGPLRSLVEQFVRVAEIIPGLGGDIVRFGAALRGLGAAPDLFDEAQRNELRELVFGQQAARQPQALAPAAEGLRRGISIAPGELFGSLQRAISVLEGQLQGLQIQQILTEPTAELAKKFDDIAAQLTNARREAERLRDVILATDLPDIQIEAAATIGGAPRVSESIAREGQERERQLRAEAAAFVRFQQDMQAATAGVFLSLADFGGLLAESAAGLISFRDALQFGLSGIGGALGGALGESIGKGVGGALGIAAGPIGTVLGSVAGGIIGNTIGALFEREPEFVNASREFANTLRDEFAAKQQTIADLEKALEFIRNVRIDFLQSGPQRGFESLEQIDFVSEELQKEFERLTGTTDELNEAFTRAINIPNVFRAELARFEADRPRTSALSPLGEAVLGARSTIGTQNNQITVVAAPGESSESLADRLELELARRARRGGSSTVSGVGRTIPGGRR